MREKMQEKFCPFRNAFDAPKQRLCIGEKCMAWGAVGYEYPDVDDITNLGSDEFVKKIRAPKPIEGCMLCTRYYFPANVGGCV